MLRVEVRHSFGAFDLDVAFDAPGGLTALFGQSGAGKSSVINAVAGLLRADHAKVVLDGEDLSLLALHKRRIGYVFQQPRLFPHLSVRGNLTYSGWFRPKGGMGFDPVVALLGLEHLLDRRPHGLSGGEQQRVAIGRALLSNPRILLMDEPLSALDHARKSEILPYLERLRDTAGLPILYVSHALTEVARLATSILVIEAGKTRAFGPAVEVLSDPALAQTLGLRDAGSLITARVAGHEADGLTRMETAVGPIFLPRIAAELGQIARLRIPAQDVMISMTRPAAISALNVLPVLVEAVRSGEGPGAILTLRLGEERLLARLTQRSVQTLALVPGQQVFAVLKTVALAQGETLG